MKNIPMLDLRQEYGYLKPHIDAALKRCLEHQQWIMGPEVAAFERAAAAYLGCGHCIGVSSGTDALVVSLRALALKLRNREYFERSDRIITTPFTFAATADTILRAGATPVFADIDPATFNLDPENVRQYCRRESAIGVVPVHLYGHSCDMDGMAAAAKEYGLFVLEDVAQAFGGTCKGRKLGTLGDIAGFSFFPSKNLGCFGDGGMIASGDERLAGIARILMKHGGKDKYNVEHIGYNARLDTIQAAVLNEKLKVIDEFNTRRCRIARLYSESLKEIPDIAAPVCRDYAGHVYHQYTIRVKNGRRDALQERLKANGIASMVYYPIPLHSMSVFAGLGLAAGPLRAAEEAAREVLSLPVGPLMTEDDAAAVAGAVREAMKRP